MEKQFSFRKELPRLLPLGFKIIKCPEVIFNPLIEYYHYRKELNSKEKILVLYDNPKFCQWLIDSFHSIFQQEVQLPIEFSHLWGIKHYGKGSSIPMWKESLHTHHLSSQIIVSQDKDWPFYIWDYNNKLHTISTSPGDIILYEGSKRRHGRTQKYKGKNYDLIYLSYKLKDWKYIFKDLDK